MSKLKKALQKAREARSSDIYTLTRENDINYSRKNGDHVDLTHELDINYSKTKVEHVDYQTLRKNRVVSLFQENEITDQINVLRTQILKKLSDIGGNCLLVTSANPGEGKTFTSINLGVSIAQELNRTALLIDGDLRKNTKHHYDFARDFFGINVNKGLSDYLLGKADLSEIILNPGIQKLTIVPASKSMPNSAELLGSSRMKRMLDEVRCRYRDRIIVVDGPALLTCTDPVVLSSLVDGVLVVVESEKTTPNDLKRLIEFLKGKVLLGTVLNKAR